jgi:hypothetical protein
MAESEEEGEDGYLDHRRGYEAYSKDWCPRVELESDGVGKAEHNLMLFFPYHKAHGCRPLLCFVY